MPYRLLADPIPSRRAAWLRAARTLALALVATTAFTAAHAGVPPGGISMEGNGFVDDKGQPVLSLSSVPNMTSAAWQRFRISLTTSFKVHFAYTITTDQLPGGNGLAFVIQSEGDFPVGDGGDGIGFQGLLGVASVVQTTQDMLGFSLSSDPISAPAAPVSFANAYKIAGEEVVTYNAIKHVLAMRGTVKLNEKDTYPVSDERDIDLSQAFGTDLATIGFTGADSDLVSTIRITRFSFETQP